MSRVERTQERNQRGRQEEAPENISIGGRESGRGQTGDRGQSERGQSAEARQSAERGSRGERSPYGEREQEQGGALTRQPYYGSLAMGGGSPFSFMRRFSEEMDRLFDDFGFGGSPFSPLRSSLGGSAALGGFGPQSWAPAVEVFTRGDKLVIRADVPGVNKEDLRIDVQNGAVVIQGERRRENQAEREGRWHTERSYGKFVRTIALPEGARADDAHATFKDGVLEIAITLPQETRGRRIEIEA